MAKTDYPAFYGLEGVREQVQERLDELRKAPRLVSLDTALGVESHFEHYDIRRRNDKDVIRFSTDRYKESSPHVLLLSADVKYAWSPERLTWFITRRRIVAALAYKPTEKGVEIEYVQTVSGIQLEQYQKAQEIIGVRPHELFVAHFIARAALVLDMYPDMEIQFPKDIWPRNNRSSYSIINERFAKYYLENGIKIPKLSPYKERVRQIFGSESPWLEAAAKTPSIEDLLSRNLMRMQSQEAK